MKVGMTQFMKNYAYKFTQMVSTCKQAAERMAPLWRGEKAAAELSMAKPHRWPSCCGFKEYFHPHQPHMVPCGCTWPGGGSRNHPFPYIAPPVKWPCDCNCNNWNF